MVTLKKFKKIWKKSFSDEELIAINQKIQDFSNEISLHIFNSDLIIPKDFNQSRVTFAYLETDRWDGSEGISPKQLKKLINIWGENYIIALWCLSLLSSKYLLNEVFAEDEDNVRIVSYKELLKLDDFKVFFENKEESLKFMFTKLGYTCDAVNNESIQILSLMHMYGTLKEQLINLDSVDVLDEVSNEWRLMHNVVPQEKFLMIALKPKDWQLQSFSDSMNSLYGVRQFRKLDKSDMIRFVNFYKKAGTNAGTIISLLGKDGVFIERDLSSIEFTQEMIAFINRVFDKEKDLDISTKIDVMFLSKEEKVRNIYNETSNIKKILEIQDYSILFDFVPIEKIFQLRKFNFSKNTLEVMKTIFENTRNIVSTIPIGSGIINDHYRWEILPKSNFDSILAGNYTQCCQHVDGVGKTCVTIGAYRENITIFAVYKDHTMVCQSMLWRADDYIVADSIEPVSSGYTKYIEKAYIELAEHFENNDLELIFGATGRLDSDNLTSGYREEIVSNQQYIPDIYSDASSQERLKGRNE